MERKGEEEHKDIVTYVDFRGVHAKVIEEMKNNLDYLLKSDMDLVRMKLEKFTKLKDETLLKILYGKRKIKGDLNKLEKDLNEYKVFLETLKNIEVAWHEDKHT